MALTVAEKEHWKERIGKRIEHRIETLVAKKDPTLLQRVAEQARERAYNSLGIFAQHVELQQIEKQKAELDRRERRLKAEQRAIIRGTPVEQELEEGYYHENMVESSVTARAQALEADILSESELGKQILALRAEKDNLLDTVWLATSTSQVKELWEQVNSLLQITPTNLEDKALKIRPVQEE
jgi:hypothetical protein